MTQKYKKIFFEILKNIFRQINAYYSGEWTGEEYVGDCNNECNFHLARILEYMECPQYLRKAYFPFQKPLNFAGICLYVISLQIFRCFKSS